MSKIIGSATPIDSRKWARNYSCTKGNMLTTIFYSAKPKEHPATGYWDQALLLDLLSNPILKNMVPQKKGAIVIIPGAYQGQYVDHINQELAKHEWVLLFITSDEESKFPVEEIKHQNIKIWVQYPKQGRHDQYGKLPLGYTTETRKFLHYNSAKPLDVFYSGQKSHIRREECSEALKRLPKGLSGLVNDTPGFSQGFLPSHYMENMCAAKMAPAPSGPISADSFRTYEALEAGAVPIADQISPAGDYRYWNYLFGGVPFATINQYESLPGYCKDIKESWPQINIDVQAWWIKKKRDLVWQFVKEIEDMGGGTPTQMTTAIIPVSPIKSHPSIEVLEKTIDSIRANLPTCEIIITFDGVREEQEDRRDDYNEAVRRALYKCNTEWNAIPIIFHEHTHQVGMARIALEHVKTPLILYVEQDTPLVTDEPIEWQKLKKEIMLGTANVIRFHYEAFIPEPHKHLMIGEPENGLLKTIQWSQRPHLALTAFYKYILEKNFSSGAKCFIEDKLHSVVQQDYQQLGMRGWDIWKLFIYYPEGGNIKRSLNEDGRQGAPKYDETQVF